MRDGSKQIFKFWYVACVTWANCSVKTWIPTMFAKHHKQRTPLNFLSRRALYILHHVEMLMVLGMALEIRLKSKYTLPLELLIYRWFAGMFHNVPVFSCDKLWLQGAMLSNQQHFTLMTVRPWIVLTANLGRKSSSSPKLFLLACKGLGAKQLWRLLVYMFGNHHWSCCGSVHECWAVKGA